MSDQGRQAHWQGVYTTKGEKEVSWYQDNPAPSLELIALAGVAKQASIVDVGGGASRLVDHLLAQDFERLTVLDLSAAALDAAKARLGEKAKKVRWEVADITKWNPPQAYDLWHDRAAFHFLTDAADQSAYVERVRKAIGPGGHVIIGTFALDGPERCSGLPIVRYDSASLSALLGPQFSLIDARRHDHLTPWGAVQRFHFSTFRRSGNSNRLLP
jgi:SAM-dependent methyltransferase